MSIFGCNCRCSCAAFAAIVSAVAGVLAAFLQITAVIALTPVYWWVVFGIAVAYLAVLLVGAPRCTEATRCKCTALDTLLAGILGAILFSVVLLTIPFAATSIIGAIVVGLAVFFFALLLTATACLVRTLFQCS